MEHMPTPLIKERHRLYTSRFKYLEKLIDERDRLYDGRFKAAEIAVQAALAAAEKGVNAAFLASEKAIVKAEQAQKEYNERSNEFRAQLDDQAKTLMPRTETLTIFKGVEDKLLNIQANAKNELEAAKAAFEKTTGGLDTQLESLRSYRSEREGGEHVKRDQGQQRNWSIGIIVAVGSGLLAVVVSVIGIILSRWK